MDSKQASDISNTSSGTSSIESSHLYDSEIETLVKTNGVKSDMNDSNNFGSIDGGGSDDGGFVSGEEEFETASERPIVADPDEVTLEKGTEGNELDDPFVGSSDFVTSIAETPVAMPVLGDDVEEDPRVGKLGGGKIEDDGVVLGEESGVGGGLGTSPVVENGVNNKISVDSIDSNPIGVGAAEIFVDATGENLNSSELVGGDADKGTENSKLGDVENVAVVGSPALVETGLAGVQSEDLNTKNFVALAEANDGAEGVKEIAFSSGDGNLVETKIIEPAESESELVESDGVKFTAEGDSLVEEIHVNLSKRGVVVVGEAEENKDSDTKAVQFQVNGSARLDTSSEPLMNHNAETSESEFVGLKTDVPVEINRDDDDGGSENLDVVKKEKTLEAEIKPEFDSEAGENDSIVKGAGADEDGVHAADSVSETILADTVQEVKHLEGDINGVSSEPHPPKYDEQDGSLDTGAIVSDDDEVSESLDTEEEVKTLEAEVKPEPDSEAKENDSTVKVAASGIELVSDKDQVGAYEDGVQAADSVDESIPADVIQEAKYLGSDRDYVSSRGDGLEDGFSGESHPPKYDEPSSIFNPQALLESEDDEKDHTDEEGDIEGSVSDGETDGLIFGSSEAAKQFIEELERESGAGSQFDGESSHDHSQRIDGQIVTDSDEEVDDADEGDGKELFDSAALAALLKAATGADPDSGGITISSQDGSRLFSVERPAGLGSSLRALRPTPRSNRPNIFSPSLTTAGESETNLSGEEKMKLEKLQLIRVKFLRIVQRLGLSTEESIAAQVLYRLALVAGRQTSQLFSLDAAKRTAMELEEDGKNEDLDFSVNILVLGKSGVGKSATINSLFNENKALIDAFEPTTNSVKEISGMVDGVKIKVFDSPGLKASVMEQAFNRKVLSSIQKFTKKSPPDIVLYVDRLDAQTRDLNDLPLLKTITGSLGQAIWRSAIVTLTHGASAPPDGPSGSPLSYEVFVAQRSHVVQHSIGQAVGDLRMMSPSLMNPVSLVENHPSCRKNREGQKVLPNGQSWRPQLLLLCYSMKILAEVSSLSKPQDPFDHRKLFGRVRAPPLPYLLSSMLQTRAHPKLSADQGGDNGGDSDIDLADLSDSDQEDEEDEYDQLPPFKPLRKSQIAKLTNEQRKAYFEEYDYRVKLLRKKQWREELKRLKEIKKRGNDAGNEYGYLGEDADQENSPAPVAVPLPDMALPPSFDGDTPAYRYRFLEPSSQFLARPVLDTHGWDHDCGYDGVSLENSLAIASQFPAAVAVQITKDKKEFSIHLDSSVSAKHGENGSSMVGFDIQTIGKQLAYVIRGETKFKNLKKNKTATGVTITFLGENVATGFKIEDQIALGKQWGLSGSGGIVRSNGDSAYGANFELQHRELDYPIGPVQSTYSLSLIKWRGDWALGLNTLAQFSIGRSSKVAVRAGINNKLSGQITVRTSSSDSLSFALAGIIPIAINIYKKIWPSVGESYSIY